MTIENRNRPKVNPSCRDADTPHNFLKALQLGRHSIVSIVGAGGKTSLLFRLASEARARGDRVLVTTSTKLEIPEQHQYDAIDLSGKCFAERDIRGSQIHVAGLPAPEKGKMVGCDLALLQKQNHLFDLVLIEADGAARRSLKGWHSLEPVVAHFTSHTVGLVDISTIGKRIDDKLVHRMEIFTALTGSRKGESVSIEHLQRLVMHDRGLFAKARGEKILLINKVESRIAISSYKALTKLLPHLRIIATSIHQGKIYD